MAVEMVTGALVSTFIERTIDTLASRFVDLFRGRKHNKKRLSDLKMKLLAIDVVAFDAEQKQFTYPRVRDWLLKAKDVVLDAEDLLDEIDYELSKSQLEAESQTATNKVWNSLKSTFVSFFENEIESRMEQVIEDLEDLATQSDFLGLKTANGVGAGSASGSKLTYTSLPNETVIYGRDDDKEFVLKWLTSDTHNQLSILSIVGMGGLGKTSLAQHVFNDPFLEDKFDVKAWVCVPQEFDVLNVSRAILEHVTESTDNTTDLEMVHKRLKEKLTGKKFLLVLDDNWNENQSKWEQVQKALCFGAQGSRLLVTTRNKNVAIIMRSEEHHLKVLKEEYCWDLFDKHAFQSPNPELHPDFMEIGKKIVQKCNGLPLALKTMGSLLHNKSSLWGWESILKSEIWDFSENECNVLPVLRLSYHHLPSHLKKCFAICALFPKGYMFDKESLIQIWMAQNFLASPLQKKNPREVGEQYFNDLLSWSFFQPSLNENCFIMHDLLNDLAKYVCEDNCIRLGVDEPKGIPKTTRHFSFSTTLAKYFFDGFGSLNDTKKLHTFIPYYGMLFPFPWYCKMSIDDLFSKFKLIRVLSLSLCKNLKEVPKSVGNLKHLRSLDLSYTPIENLPVSISSLYKLQILKLNYCQRLKELPSCLHQLDKLCLLELKHTRVQNVHILAKLKNLQILMSSFRVDKSKGVGIEQLGELNLYGSLTIEKLQNIESPSYALEADLKNKLQLQELNLEWNIMDSSSVDSTKVGDVIENLRPSKYLKKLSIGNYIGKQLPNWLFDNSFSLPNLVSLVLRNCKCCQRFPPLGLLPFLKKLEISGFDEIVKIDADFHGNKSSSFKSLETLFFYNMRQWKKWECNTVTGAFPRLECLCIQFCRKLKGDLPELLVPLKSLCILYCQQLEASAPRALHLELCNCGKLQLDRGTVKMLRMEASLLEIVRSNTLEHLTIYYPRQSVSLCNFPLDFFPTLRTLSLIGFRNLHMISQCPIHNYLEHLKITDCPKFESLPENIHMLSSLKSLEMKDCPRIESFPYGGLPSNLEEMRIKNCSKLESLPGNMHMLSSLRRLHIRYCSSLESFPDKGLPPNLADLEIVNCSRLIGSLKGAFGDNPSLESLRIGRVHAESFPDEGLLPLSLTSLTISHSPNLEKLDYKGLCQLSSLQRLTLYCCVNLQRLPEEGLPKSISHFQVSNCPLLKQRCLPGGEDWEKVAHIKDLHTEMTCLF